MSFQEFFIEGDLEPRPQLKEPEEKFMFEALKEAYKAYEAGEVPVGAVVVLKGRIIARAHNQVEMLKDATAHAEMLAFTIAENHVENWRLTDCHLYSTLEPCAMCLGASFLTRIQSITWAAEDKRHGACGSWVNLLEKEHPTHQIKAEKGSFGSYSEYLMKSFFAKRREEKKSARA
jgi:tRNA(adenine34) deaminase